ncbi:MAG: hypothetical protein V1651_02310, partial [Patescibacteria group bacterium]
EESLEKIYQDDNGKMIDVKKMIVRKKKSWLKHLGCFLLTVIFVTGLVYAGYYFFALYGPGLSSVNLIIEGNEEAVAGEEFSYIITFNNNERISMKNVEIKLTYPENFVFLDSEPVANQGDDIYRFATVDARRSEIIKIRGKLVGEPGSSNIIIADARYTPDNFSSEFKKSASLETAINEVGLDVITGAVSSAFVNEENEISLKLKAKEINYLSDFLIIADCPDNWEIIKDEVATSSLANTASTTIIKQIEKNIWQVGNLGKAEQELKIKFKVKEKKEDNQVITLKLAQKSATPSGDKNYVFFSKVLSYEILQSGLNLNMIINGSPIDQGADLGQTLNYTINYTNKSATDLKDIVLMAVLEGDLLDWNSVKVSSGQIQNNAISWTKADIPALENLVKDGEGVIDFSIKIKQQDQIASTTSPKIKSYAQFSTGGRKVKAGETNSSNIIINKINSDLNLTEQVRYFNDDNIAVGSGPLPPKVDQTTSLKVYWTINNNLHELNNLIVSTQLPDYVKFGNKSNVSVGSLDYDEQNNIVTWDIGRLPISTYKVNSEFNIEITPKENNRNKILVLLSGTNISAIDSETNATIKKTMEAQTTRLKDDNIANTDGIVE